ncbi:MAG: hypothetical protein ACRDK9_08805 [Solirubrobacterales bacterium]
MSTATKTRKTQADAWLCARCEMTIRWMAGHEPTGPPAGWATEDGETYCLACRRDRAAEAAVCTDATIEDRAKQRRAALLAFEIERDPERPNGEIARAVRCSVPAVVKARKALGKSAKA